MFDECSVKVAVRVRPLLPYEISKGCKEIIESFPENNQILIRSIEKAFTFNYVFGTEAHQEDLYNRSVQPLLEHLFEGKNVTIFAYGQTGSGKTYSMGTVYKGQGHMGVIPRAIEDIFKKIQDNFSIDFTVSASFTELYRESLYDLLANKPKEQSVLELREDATKGVYIPNITEVAVESAKDVLEILMKGSQSRATGATNMNAESSRSHSTFTINFAMQHKTDKSHNKTAKLHLVDLAGSERPKKTGAQGTTFKEGVDINKGLFVLGNVISALGDEKLQNGFIPYRDSNLTRLLKDSLGGNSVTLMIACISPADYNLEETVSTLRYADRARKIKNKPIVNQDPKVAEINMLKKQIKQLHLQIVEQGGPVISCSEMNRLKIENEELGWKIKDLRHQLSAALLDKTGLHEILVITQNANENLSNKLAKLKDQYDITLANISLGLENNDVQHVKDNMEKLQQLQKDVKEIHDEHVKTEKEIRKHEETFTILLHTSNNSAREVPEEYEEKQECHTSRQIMLSSELQEISRQLLLKEQLANQLQINTRYMVDEQAMIETNKKIESLEKEKDELLQHLKNVKTQEASSKIAEQRRKRVQELEQQLKDLKKKINEQGRLIKLKEKDELKIKQLHQEISSMKSLKVKLLKQMRENADRFRNWKQQSERQLAKITEQDRKKQNEIVKMKLTYEKQKNVLKRKFEEAAALNKRLQGTITKRQQAQEIRFNGKIEKISSWLKNDFEVYLNLVEAETALAGLLEDRATLYQQLNDFKNNPETCDCPEVKILEEDIELRSVQIQDLQQKLLDSDEENKTKTRFDKIQTMVDAKYALRTLYEQAADSHKEKVQFKRELAELEDNQKELIEKLESFPQQLKTQKDTHAEQIATQQKTYEEKVSILLRQLRGINAENEDENDTQQNRRLILDEHFQEQQKKIEEQAKLISELQKRIEVVKKPKVPKAKVLKTEEKEVFEECTDIDADECFTDDEDKDPDWRRTPLGKRILAEKRLKLRQVNEAGGSKRSSEGGCTCKTKCNTVRCGCRKLSRGCSFSCRCNEGVCENRNLNEVSSTENSIKSISSVSSVDSDQDTTFKKPRMGEDGMSLKKKLKNKRLFQL